MSFHGIRPPSSVAATKRRLAAPVRRLFSLTNSRRKIKIDFPMHITWKHYRIVNNAMGLEAFKQVEPANQPDAAG
jgi:hypothetical protein